MPDPRPGPITRTSVPLRLVLLASGSVSGASVIAAAPGDWVQFGAGLLGFAIAVWALRSVGREHGP